MPPGDEPPSTFQLRVKAGTAVLTVAIVAALLLHDWDKAAGGGPPTVFSSVRPAVKAWVNRVYGVGGTQQQQEQRQRQQQEQQGQHGGPRR